MQTRGKPSPATVIASIALFVALANTAAGQLGGGGSDPGSARLKATAAKVCCPANSIGAKQLKPNAVTETKIKEGAITPPAIAPGAITPPAIAGGAITPPAISASAVGAAQIAPGAVIGGKIAAGAVKGEELADDAVGSSKIQAASILAGKLADDSVGSEKIKGGAVTTGKLGDEAVDTGKIKGGAVTSPLLGAGAVTTPKIGPLAVTAPTIATGSVGTQQLSTGIPSASAQSSAIQCRTINTTTVDHFASQLFDTANLWPGGGGADYRMTAPVDGVYQVTATQMWDDDGGGGIRSMEFDGRQADNSTPFGPLGFSVVPAINGGASETPQSLTGIYKLTAGQSIEVWSGTSGMGATSGGQCGTGSTSFGNSGSRTSTFTMTYLNSG